MSYSTHGRNPFQGGVESEFLEALTPLMRYRYHLAEDPRRSVVYHVDIKHGDDGYDGLTWDSPVETIARAIALNNATVTEWPKHYNSILVRPGAYPENLDALPNFCSIIGVGGFGQEMARIDPPTGSIVTGNANMVGCHLANLEFRITDAADKPIFDLNVCNSNLIEDCLFSNHGTGNPTGIDTQDCNHLTLRRNRFISGGTVDQGFDYGIYHRGGADKFAQACLYIDNWIFAETAAIYIEDICTDLRTVIQHNFIGPHDLATALAIGIDDNSGSSWVIDNFINADIPIQHAGGNNYLIANHITTSPAGGGSVETAATT